MLILISVTLLIITGLVLILLRLTRPEFRFTWLIALSGSILSWVLVMLWQLRLPLSFTLPAWQPPSLFPESPSFLADALSWPYAVSLATLGLATIFTSSGQEGPPNPFAWAGSLILCALGLLSVTAANPLTLALFWAAIDLTELVTMLRSIHGREASERVVISFSTRAAGIGFLIWSDVVSTTSGSPMTFQAIPSQAGLFLVVAAGLRLGVLPLHLPYSPDSNLRRGFGTSLRLVSAASSLILLARIPPSSLESLLTPLLFLLTAIAALYASWMWLRSPDELSGRPFWIIGLGSLATAAALSGNPTGATAWGVTLVLAGAAMFLTNLQQTWLNRAILVGVWSLSSLPFSLSASGWQINMGGFIFILPVFLVAQAFLIAGFIRQSTRSSSQPALKSQPAWTQSVYPIGIYLLVLMQLILGIWGWDGGLQFGLGVTGLAALLLSAILLWAARRFAVLNPGRAHWVQPAADSRLDQIYRNLWTLYRWAGRLSQIISDTLEGDSGIMWTLLFLVLFVSLFTQRKP